MAESQSDRLKRELRFLKESYEAGIISEEEYNKGKNRIESKLAEWGEGVVETYKRDDKKEEIEIVEEDESFDDGKEEVQQEKKVNNKNRKDEDNVFSSRKKEKKVFKEQKKDRDLFESDDFEGDKMNKKSGIIWKIAAVVIILVIAALIVLFFMNRSTVKADFDTDFVILTDKNCDSCDTRSAEAVIEKLFPNLTKSYVDYNTAEGKALYKIGVKYLPAYIFKDTIEQTDTWNTNEAIKNSFEKKGEFWALQAAQTGSNWKP
jgi:uncharacterized membrane protein